MGGKKRKFEYDLESEKSQYSLFVNAANSISQLYSGSINQQRKAGAHASRATLERILMHILKDYGSVDAIPKAALLHMLHQEYESVEGSENLPHSFPVQLFPQPPTGPAQTDNSSPQGAPVPSSMGLDATHQKRQHQHYTAHPNLHILSPLSSRRSVAFPYAGGGGTHLGTGHGPSAGMMEVSSDQEQQEPEQMHRGGPYGSYLPGFGVQPFGGAQQ